MRLLGEKRPFLGHFWPLMGLYRPPWPNYYLRGRVESLIHTMSTSLLDHQ